MARFCGEHNYRSIALPWIIAEIPTIVHRSTITTESLYLHFNIYLNVYLYFICFTLFWFTIIVFTFLLPSCL